MPTPPRIEPPNGDAVSRRIRAVLASRGLSLADLARASRSRYPGDASYRIPHNLYARIDSAGFIPTIQQFVAFSEITKYRLADWLAVFGFHLDRLLPLAAAYLAARTVLLDSSVYDDQARIPWFRSKSTGAPFPPIAPLGHLLESGPLRQLKTLVPDQPSPFLYAKIGRQDVMAYPDLLPGSIVRVDTRRLPTRSTPSAQSLYLLEHGKGLVACRLHFAKGNTITLRSSELPYAEVALELGREARILGTLDWEFRFLANSPAPEVARDLALFAEPQPFPPTPRGFGEFVARRRRQMGLSLREASLRSRLVADQWGSEKFLCARATLAGYERSTVPPRHIHRILALCALYSLTVSEVLAATGLRIETLGQDPIPRAVLGDAWHSLADAKDPPDGDSVDQGFLSDFLRELEEIPLFLRSALASLTGVPGLSVRDLLWLGGTRVSFHPYLAGARLAAIDGRERRPPPMGKRLLRDQPVYVVLHRDGSYLCARCTIEGKTLVMHPLADGFEQPARWRNGVDAEIVGKVTALLRKL